MLAMGRKIATLRLFIFICVLCHLGQKGSDAANSTLGLDETNENNGTAAEFYQERLNNQSRRFENNLKYIIKGALKTLLPNVMRNYNGDISISTKCTSSLMKYISGLTAVKVWAIKMLDATSKPPSGAFEGTLNEFGGFDQCLRIELPRRNGGAPEFRGKYCAIEARPLMAPTPRNLSMAKQSQAHPLATVAEEVKIAGMAFHYLKFRLGACVPSTCSLQDMQAIAKRVANVIQFEVEIPQCYVKEAAVFTPIHIVVICVLSLLLLACIIGTLMEHRLKSMSNIKPSTPMRLLMCFSVPSNFNRLLASSQGSDELKALHGLRALTMAWVILGHTYAWTSFQLLRSPNTIVGWFNSIDFGVLHNAWLSVEPFFFLSGLLTSYAVIRVMEKTKGKISVPIYILRRYIRLTPALLLTIGLAFFMPLISSGPFWYEKVDPELKACTENWWTSVLYISNWTGMRNICVHPTWYLSADFQLHVFSIILLYLLYRSPKLGLALIGCIVILCGVIIGVLTHQWDLPPTVQISSGHNQKIQETIDVVHMRTFTHAGPYYVGIVVGYLMVKYKDVKFTRVVNVCGWCTGTLLALVSLYGAHRWNTGNPHGPLLTCIYAAVHRTTFTMGVAWVTFACVTGHGGPVNRLLSSPLLAPFGRLTFMVYLIHSLVIWVRMGSMRERLFYSHYNLLYEYAGNILFTLTLTVPLYLMLEAPLGNLERLLFSRMRVTKEETDQKPSNGHLAGNVHFVKVIPTTTVELKGVKSLDLVQSVGATEDVRNI